MHIRLFFYLVFFVFVQWHIVAQPVLPNYPDSLFGTYFHQRHTLFKNLPSTPDDIIFLGNSITDGNEWGELFNDLRIKNRGISGDYSAGILYRCAELVNRKPAKIFLMIGINDLSRGISTDSLVRNIRLFADYTAAYSPSTKLYVLSLLPVNAQLGKFGGHTSRADSVPKANRLLKEYQHKHNYQYVDLYSAFCDVQGRLDLRYTNDGLHLTGEGYQLWKHLVYPYVYDLQGKPSIIPKPKSIQWGSGYFVLSSCNKIYLRDSAAYSIAQLVQSQLPAFSKPVSIQVGGTVPSFALEIYLNQNDIASSESYTLEVTPAKIILQASSLHGLFNAAQTFSQLCRNQTLLDVCLINDTPAFSWRGYMVDVGRNFQSIRQLKQQIEIMARYKMNIFHFHLTEDIAWRIESKAFPRLNEPSTMLRNPGEFYTYDQLRELIAFCKERFITLVPEIDMPGHSAAFRRALGYDMQSDSGVLACKTIIKELAQELDVPYIHIGGDEVRVTNKDFMNEITLLLQSLGKTGIAWDPGAKVVPGTYLQMWIGSTKPKPGYSSIDSRHLYLNHFDPLEGVSATFNHLVCDTVTGSSTRLGATLCNWPDRRVSNEADLIKMNAVYPTLLAFAERTWCGGGHYNFTSVIGNKGTTSHSSFVEFENRLLDHSTLYFSSLSFPYVKQQDVTWHLIGPYSNEGDLTKQFDPEANGFLDRLQLDQLPVVTGGTIWLRHFWSPAIGSHLDKFSENTTWYATRKIWSTTDTEVNYWIDFNNLSRNTNSDSPPVGQWDKKGSKVWVNGKEINPPLWQRAGAKGHSEIPLTDEGYAYRMPTRIHLKKGWNTVLIKAPVSTFKGESQNPVKWMFTFIQSR